MHSTGALRESWMLPDRTPPLHPNPEALDSKVVSITLEVDDEVLSRLPLGPARGNVT